jgi:hypothetical protein
MVGNVFILTLNIFEKMIQLERLYRDSQFHFSQRFTLFCACCSRIVFGKWIERYFY